METTSFTWTCESPARLLGCGVDVEDAERFRKLASEAHPWPMVFTADELVHIRALPDPPLGFCAAFACKEATLKALRELPRLTDCECFYRAAGQGDSRLRLSAALCRRHGIVESQVRVIPSGNRELICVVHLFGASEA